MCTAAAYRTNTLYFGRTLDNDITYGEKVTVTPRNYPLIFRYAGRIDSHFAVIGMAHISKGYPLYYDAMNEKGLAIAALNFPDNAAYHTVQGLILSAMQFTTNRFTKKTTLHNLSLFHGFYADAKT